MRRIRRTTMVAMATLAAMVAGTMLLLAPAASAQTGYPPAPEPTVVAQTLPPAPPPARVAATTAFTGANILRWVVIALVLVAAGALLISFNRRRTGRLAT